MLKSEKRKQLKLENKSQINLIVLKGKATNKGRRCRRQINFEELSSEEDTDESKICDDNEFDDSSELFSENTEMCLVCGVNKRLNFLLQSPLGQGMRGPGLDAPCFSTAMSSTSGRISRSGSEQFMPPSMEAAAPSSVYPAAKMHQDSPLPPPPTPTPGVHAAYMQPNPLTQLQQQTEMWHNYQDDLRPRSSGNPFMMQDIQSPYHHHQPSPPLSIPSPMMMDKHRQTPVHHIHNINPISMPMTPPHSNSIMAMTPPHSNENVPPDEPVHLKEKMMPQDFQHLDVKHTVEAPQPLMENNVQHQNEYGNSVFGASVGVNQQQSHHQQFEKMEDTKMKRSNTPSMGIVRPPYSVAPKKPSSKPLPDFNEAFGSTERGRFQSPPDPRLGPNKGYLDLFCEDGPQLKFEDFQM
ncbi:unnamed protein product [Diabrotica balteata]|uniref:Uncharacterized protein n=1 Tax=Diabrotica balteata TaxID=107213 RepID=A0A9N9SZ96_DIABA|nr:unnamed protein product [Diabrotica balteata]